MKARLVLATKQEVEGTRRKLGWFSRTPTDLYFDVGGLFLGSHMSYHKDGNIFRTSPATGNRASFEMNHLPLADFEGWHQLGVSMIQKYAIASQPHLKPRDEKGRSRIYEVDLNAYPSDTLNLILELLHPDSEHLLDIKDLQPPPDADLAVLRDFMPWVVLTILGHNHNLLVRPADDGFVVSHYNERYSANRPGQKYRYEAYKND